VLDVVVSGGRLVLPEGVEDGLSLAIHGGRIASIARNGDLAASRETIDATGLHVLPGLVDPHTHPGNLRPFEDDVRLTTRSAAVGGITTILGTVKSTRLGGEFKRFAAPEDVVSYFDRFPLARQIVERDAHIDMGLSFTIATDLQATEVARYAQELGVRSFKFHPAGLATAWHGHIGAPIAADDGTIYLALEGVAASGSLAMMHAENRQIGRVLAARERRTERADLATWERASPGMLEGSEIGRLAYFCRRLGCTLYVAHLNSREGLEAVRAARASGTRVVAETCPQYLVHSFEEDPDNALLKHTPPLRSREETEEMWRAVAAGDIQCIGSDHVPNYLEEKLGGGDLWRALSGSAEIETLLPALLHHGVREGRITLSRLAQVTAANAARVFGLAPRKGALTVGADADLTLVDLARTRTVRLATMESANETDYSTYEGRSFTGWPVVTLSRGRIVARDGAAVGSAGGGYLDRSGAAALGRDALG
jgi:dihydroorotase-like cyclic amidohydrolase